ncbi:DUF2147 domain-containing protein [Mesorhizobium sp. WSM3868]|uniref:DUF2147 domain-containing protein n=1 Tax=Mesorhizobium sp. WSM3868 TaxID=2029405 RepID=UPI000BAF9E28|nr:DUF2147 domain-containing protein [Mesorhizobium sp. WSM3868]PBB37077.1 hypothetical protein CK221_13255 [Mesorhizobium sp. WSM3868]
MDLNNFSRRGALAIFVGATLLSAAPAAHAQQASSDAIIGTWQADDGSVKLETFKTGSEFQARLLYGNQLVEPGGVTFKKDTKNPNPALRSRSMRNAIFITGLHWDDGAWTGGSLYDGSSGRTYNCEVRIKNGKMNLRGYIGLPALGQTRTFHRV